ncbi:Ig-like domain-containing protein, partial [Citrobacter sp. JGM124]|uniref:Ig-like domain-containing protein n=1 Tax=Citrobacter sp. JGM124 TaxID=2799789 RepID=UPI001BADD7F5
ADITVMARVGDTASVNADRQVSFIANIATAHVVSVELQGTDVSKIADGTSSFTYTVTVKDSNDNLVPGVTVTATADKSGLPAIPNGVTNASGEATITLTSTNIAVADITVRAQVDDTQQVDANETVSFIANSATAKVGTVELDDNVQIKVANGTNTFNYTAQLIDNNGNPVKQAGLTVKWTQDQGSAVTLPSSSVTNAAGQATITLTSTTTAVSNIQVSAQYLATPSVNAKAVNFTADSSLAKVSDVSLVGTITSQIADGNNFFTYTVTVTDTNNNPVEGAIVAPMVNQSDLSVTVNGTTDANGQAIITLTSSTKAVDNIIVSAQVGNTPSVNAKEVVSFIANNATAKVKIVTLTDTEVNKVANGINAFNYTAQVVDANDNPVKQAGITVSWSQDKGSSVVLPSSSVTDATGLATITLTSTNVAVADITVSARVGDTTSVSADEKVSFIANIATAHVVSVALQGTDVSKIANATNN